MRVYKWKADNAFMVKKTESHLDHLRWSPRKRKQYAVANKLCSGGILAVVRNAVLGAEKCAGGHEHFCLRRRG